MQRARTLTLAVPRRPAAALTALVVAAGAVTAASVTAEATDLGLAPVADATVSGASNYTNYGSASTLLVDASPIVRSYLKFTVPQTAPVTRATLRLWSSTTNATGVTANAVVGNGWTEPGIVFANAYGIGTRLGSSGPTRAGSWVSVDVSALVRAAGTYGVVLTSTSAEGQSFASRETAQAPRLVVETAASPTTGPTSSPTTGPTSSPTTSPTSPTTPPATPAPAGKLLVHHGWDVPTPGQVRTNAALIDSRPFDGITVNLPSLSTTAFSGTPATQAAFESALSPMPALSKVRHNFVIVRTQGAAYDYYDDAQWTTIASNMANLARATKANGKFAGIVLDTEYYGSGSYPWNYGTSTTPWTFSATAGATPGRSPEEARAIVTRRGKQVADALYAAWPTASVMTTYGPWVGETATASNGFRGTGYNDTAWTNELMGAFTVGMVQGAAAAPYGEYVDGGELYQARTAAQYQSAYDWINAGFAAQSVLVPPAFKPSYAANVEVSFGVFDRDMLASGWPVMSTSQWQSQLTLAMKRADRFAWAYNEVYDWLGTGWPTTPVPQSWLTATAAARAAANNG